MVVCTPEAEAKAKAETKEKVAAEPEHEERPICVSFDIETGPLPDERLRQLYVEPTYEEFAASCDARWKDATKEAKYTESLSKGWETFRSKSALSATTGQVVAIGCAWIYGDSEDNWPKVFGQEQGMTEHDVIVLFWRSVRECMVRSVPMVGHNIHGFDLPFLVQRSWVLGVPRPDGILQGAGRKYWNSLFVDTMKEWFFGDPRGHIKLDTLAKLFGYEGKTDGECCGANFHEFWFSDDAEKHQEAIDYLTRDIELPASIALAMGVV